MQKRFPLVLLGNVFFVLGMIVYVKSDKTDYVSLLRWVGSGLMVASMVINGVYLWNYFKEQKRNKN
jgi:hypothetical protein